MLGNIKNIIFVKDQLETDASDEEIETENQDQSLIIEKKKSESKRESVRNPKAEINEFQDRFKNTKELINEIKLVGNTHTDALAHEIRQVEDKLESISKDAEKASDYGIFDSIGYIFGKHTEQRKALDRVKHKSSDYKELIKRLDNVNSNIVTIIQKSQQVANATDELTKKFGDAIDRNAILEDKVESLEQKVDMLFTQNQQQSSQIKEQSSQIKELVAQNNEQSMMMELMFKKMMSKEDLEELYDERPVQKKGGFLRLM